MPDTKKNPILKEFEYAQAEVEFDDQMDTNVEKKEDKYSDEEQSEEFEYTSALYDHKHKPKINEIGKTTMTFWIRQMDNISACWEELGKAHMDIYLRPEAAFAMNSSLHKMWLNIKHGFEDPLNPQKNAFFDSMTFQLKSINDRCAEIAVFIRQGKEPSATTYNKLVEDMLFTRSELYRATAALGLLFRINKRAAYKRLLDEYQKDPSKAIEGND